MTLSAQQAADELRALREENRTLYGLIKLVSSSLELVPMLQGVVELATAATGCHACFIYLLDEGRLTIRAASPVFAAAVDNVSFSVQEGLTGWVARHRTPEFIRDRAMRDPRMKYVPLLKEEEFQSMVAVPILSRAGETIGVIVLHTRAPHEFADDTLRLLSHIASLVSGAIENAQLYDQQRRRVDTLTELAQLAQRVAAAGGAQELGALLVDGLAELLDAHVCQLLRLAGEDGRGPPVLLASVPSELGAPAVDSADELMLAALPGGSARRAPGGPGGSALWPSASVGDVLVVPLSAAGDRVGLLCLGAAPGHRFGDEDAELARATAHLAAVALKRAELIEGLTHANLVKDLFEALAAGATDIAAAKAAEARCELTGRYVVVLAEPLRAGRGRGPWEATAATVAERLAALTSRYAIETGPGSVRALLTLDGSRSVAAFDALVHESRELARVVGVTIGVSDLRQGPDDAGRAYREARDAATIARALMGDGGAIAYSEVGAYRYLVQISAQEAPRDRMRVAVDTLIEYDRKRRTALLDTLERYLSERRSVIESARSLYIHPNTLRQRLGRIEELTGLDLESDDLLSLELAIKLARLHGRP